MPDPASELMRRLIYDRYFRKTIRHPEGVLVHHGYCHRYAFKICTCGLLHDLMFLNENEIEGMYPTFGEEMGQQINALETYREQCLNGSGDSKSPSTDA